MKPELVFACTLAEWRSDKSIQPIGTGGPLAARKLIRAHLGDERPVMIERALVGDDKAMARFRMADADMLAKIGAALYGERWQSTLARELSVSDRTVRRWVAGDATVPAGVLWDLGGKLKERAQHLQWLSESFDQ